MASRLTSFPNEEALDFCLGKENGKCLRQRSRAAREADLQMTAHGKTLVSSEVAVVRLKRKLGNRGTEVV